MYKSNVFFAAIFLFGIALSAFGQSADRIDEIIEQERLTQGSAAYLAAASAEIVAPDASDQQALEALAEEGLSADDLESDEPISLGEFSYIFMLAHEMPGGVMYTIAPGPRYAYRQMRHEQVFRSGGDPNDTVTGTRAMRLIGRMLTLVEERE